MRLKANLALLSLLAGLTSCGFPTNELTAEERQADMSWAFTILEHNYAPAELKKSNFGIEMSQV
ncbi:MAG: hypothetical protein MJK18_04400, partial [Bdellovibrionales bacterium]|nr:hypothetical protein [Bdellovibrionales bacterium]